MSFDNDQSESMTTLGNNSMRTSVDLLPKYFRTPPNKKFLNSTIDQLISEGNVEKLNVFIGRKDTPAYKTSDRYLKDVSEERQSYQLEPSVVSQDELGNITYFKDYNDYVNQLSVFSGNKINHDKANREEFYSWDPHIDWDKFVNYREYYWLPNGPQAIEVIGERSVNIIKNYEISLSEEVDNIAYLFNPEGPLEALIRNPVIKLYRGETYIFDVDCEIRPINFKTARTIGYDNFYTKGIVAKDENNNIVTNTFIAKGKIEFTVPLDSPNIIYYISEKDIDSSGYFEIFDRTDATEIDVEKEIIGLKNYTTSRGVKLSNGMKIFFNGNVTPEKYSFGHWYVEGVGKAISLVSDKDLETPSSYTTNQEIEFDNENFDSQGFDVNNNFPKEKDYITINRASRDRNAWSRHNRWFHQQVIDDSAAANNQSAILDSDARAKRPIIEFLPNLQLFNFGKVSKANVTLVDDSTTDVFSNVEGSIGYYVDQTQLVEGMRVLFIADPDPIVYGRIFKVSSIIHLGVKRLTLVTDEETEPLEGQCVLITDGVKNKGKTYYYQNSKWFLGQEKTSLNQPPLFDVFDDEGMSFASEKYNGSTFNGSKIFSYKSGNIKDKELNFGVSYKSIGNFGDLLFEFNLHTDTFLYQKNFQETSKKIDTGYIAVNRSLTEFKYENGWTTASFLAFQYLVTEITVDRVRNFFELDMYEDITSVNDVTLRAYINGKIVYDTDFSITNVDGKFYVEFFYDLNEGDFLIFKTKSKLRRKSGYYEIPSNLENNPENLSLTDFTLGEINNHVKSIVDSIPSFTDTIPGKDSLRDLGNITPLGTKIVQHSAPILPINYHITNKDFNVVKAIRLAKEEYSKFKRNFIRAASTLGFDGTIRNHVDFVLNEVSKDNTKRSAYYLSDMIPTKSCFIFDQEVIDDSVIDYPLIFNFDLTVPNEKAVLIYKNENLLIYGKDYIFVNENFVRILAPIANGDNLKICQYESTDGCFCPPTPSKLGLYPLFEPKIFIDDTYQTPTTVIQGHDGSIIVAFDDYRDDLILEFEKRIFNNVKNRYDRNLFDLYDFIPGNYRTTDFNISEINTVLAQDFLNWTSLISDDYTKHTFFNLSNSKTYNYKKFISIDDKAVPGFWRAIFKEFYDTDRPNTRPWEMLGFSIEPNWWQDLYGPAPYTSDNLILWNDLQEGIIREPGVLPRIDKRFVRPNLLDYIPVNSSGDLKSPLDIGLIKDFDSNKAELEFTFGDEAPIESAWRRSSEYPFSLLRSLVILAPARVFATCFDRSRQIRDKTGQIVYKVDDGNLRFNIANIKITSTSSSSTRTNTSGLINYVVDFIIRNQSPEYVENYISELKNLQVRLATKLGGFTTKDKFKLILDSRNPLNKTNVFVPDENYNIILNTSSPLETVTYSGVIVEKTTSGYIIKGYSRNFPYFNYFPYRETTADPTINVGGISEPFVEWESGKFYHKGRIVKNSVYFYRTKDAHSSEQFDEKYFSKLPKLPIEGGRDIKIRTTFDNEVRRLVYGTELSTIQDVVDFLLGYGEYLASIGFEFTNFNSEIKNVTDFQISAKEFAFWTTQNWAAGSAITFSPLAESVQFKKDYVTVDNVLNNFYDYSIFKQDGRPLDPIFTSNVRSSNSFSLKARNTTDGIYHIALNLVQKEHVLILDNLTVFNDVIYDQIQGYRQERIKVIGYRTSDWQGTLNVPGFIYDQAKVTLWEPWKDYNLGDSVKFKEFYYSAISNVSGSEEFDFNQWYKLDSRPTSKLIPNWSYRANQFADFYDLDTDSFDVDQQKFAQHLIGYQKREYLQNIINDEVSQYKFYQGMIQDKGTNNSLSKLFNALSSSNFDSLEFHDEWAIRLGQYGANQSFDEVEFILDESKFLLNPQPIELVKNINPNNPVDFVYRILPHEAYITPQNYNHAPFPTKSISSYFVSTSGFAREDDVSVFLVNKSDILKIDIKSLTEGDNIQVAYDKNSWNIYRFTFFENKAAQFIQSGNALRIVFSSNIDHDIIEGEYVGMNGTISSLEGFHLITATGFNYIEIDKPQSLNLLDLTSLNCNFYKLVSVKLNSLDEVNNLSIDKRNNGDLVWVDSPTNNWKVWRYENNFAHTTIEFGNVNFAKHFSTDDKNLSLAVTGENIVYYFVRPSEKVSWVYKGQIAPLTTQLLAVDQDLLKTNNSFGKKTKISSSSEYLIISAPSTNKVVNTVTKINVGYVALYKKDKNNFYNFIKTVRSNNSTIYDNYFFGEFIEITEDYVFVISKGNASVGPCLYRYSISSLESISNNISLTSDSAFIDKITFPIGTEIVDTSVDDNNNIALSFANSTIKIYKILNNLMTLSQTIEPSSVPAEFLLNQNSYFAYSISLSKSGNMLAVGIFNYRQTKIGEGAAAIYKLTNNTFVFDQFISNKFKKENEKFGYKVSLDRIGSKLAVTSAGGQQEKSTYFDDDSTVFDQDSTQFLEIEQSVGSVSLFDAYNNKLIYSVNLSVGDALGINYGSTIVVTDRVYIGDWATTRGVIYEFNSSKKSWYVYRQPTDVIDIKKIKSVFLYNTETDSLITYLDIVDPLQGKILGIAEQELSFKTYYDPAVYSVGTDEVSVDNLRSWKSNNVGKLWWDLSSTKFLDSNQGTLLFKTNSWNKSYLDKLVDIYEWIETVYLPSEWDALSDTEVGLTQGISGKSKYGDSVYVVNKKYDNISKTFKNIYYFWVKNKTLVPNIEGRKLSAKDVADYISNPKDKGISYITIFDKDKFALVNCKNLLADSKVAINIRYWVIDNFQLSNIHNHYQLLSLSETSKPLNKFIEQKWFDSLAGFDKFGNPVPDKNLPLKNRYGVLNRPRQSMFVNRIEALKQFIERVNYVLKSKTIIDDFDFSKLNSKEVAPTERTGEYDTIIKTYSQIRFVSVNEFKQAKISPIVDNGKILRVVINDPGSGYKIPPNVVIEGTGSGAEIKTEIDANGSIINAIVTQTGSGYLDGVKLKIRSLTVLVLNDEFSSNKWALYYWIPSSRKWFKQKVQTYDTTRFWQYKDWYAEGYNTFTRPKHIVDFIYELKFNNVLIGELVKVKNIGQGGWILLEKINDTSLLDTTVNYKTVGRENGTIEFLDGLYNYKSNSLGFDGINFDSDTFDEIPKQELLIILDVIKNNILIDDLEYAYKELFFASLRYSFKEQSTLDWALKTSFVRATHNLGNLQQKVNYQNDNLASYQDYIDEVKPYKSKVREFVSNYETIDNTNSQIADFDLPVRYNTITGKIEPFETRIKDGVIVYNNADEILEYPFSDWFYNVGARIIAIEIADPGEGYLYPPIVNIREASTDIVAQAYISNGKLTRITFTDNLEEKFLKTPEIELIGAVGDTGRPGRAVAILGNSLVRSTKVGLKFDRISPSITYNSITVSENFVGTGNKTKFELKWPIDIIITKTTITENGIELLPSDYLAFNELDKTSSYTRYKGVIQFKLPPANLSSVVINYKKNINLLDAADRIKHFYNSKPGQIGKDLGQLMTGVDYGGVSVVGIDFDIGSGWDAIPWNFAGWDKFDETFTDYFVVANLNQRTFNLPYVPNEIEIINVYLNGVRLDDPNYDDVSPILNNLNSKKLQLTNATNALIQSQKDYDFWDLKYNTTDAELVVKNAEITQQESILNLYTPGTPEYIIENNKLIALQQQATVLFNTLTQSFNERTSAQSAISANQSTVNSLQLEVTQLTNQLAALPALTNTDAVMNSFIGNGEDNGPIIIPNSVPVPQGSRFIFRKSNSDGSFTPLQYDTQLYGGDFSYSSASGIAPEDIIVDGDGFVTPDTSHAPEEILPGHVADTVDITVYHKYKDGSPVIENTRYIIQGSNNIFSIGQLPNTVDSIVVKIDGYVKTVGIDYTVNFQELKIIIDPTLISASQGKLLTIDSFSQNGIDLLDLDYFIGDGITKEFVTAARWVGDISIFVTVDGIPVTVEGDITDDTYDKVGNVVFSLDIAPPTGSIVSYTVLGSNYNSISIVRKELITYTGESTYDLSNFVGINDPLSNNILVIKDGTILRSSDSFYFTVSGNNRTYTIDISKYALNSLDSRFVTVSVNGVTINEGLNYNWISSANQVKIKKGVANVGDRIVISILATADYEITETTIKFLNYHFINDQFTILSFTNHNILDIERSTSKLVTASSLTPGTIDYARFYQSSGGRFKLNSWALGAEYIWVVRNRKILTPNVDYILEDNLNYVVLNKSLNLVPDDIIELIVFSSDIVRKPFAYKIFKDLLNKTRYTRIDDTVSTYLLKTLNSYDSSITVEDATGLSEPNPQFNRPGVIFINGERIEYFKKNENVLSQLKRGTLGTGIKNSYPIGTLVRDQSLGQSIPYADESQSIVDISDGQTRNISLNWSPTLDQKSMNSNWFRNTIPLTFGQCNDIEVFVGGKRLRKMPITVFNPSKGPYSPNGDEVLEAEFSVNGSASVRLTVIPPIGTKIEIVRRVGKAWVPQGLNLENSPSEQAKFIRSVNAILPDATKK